MQTDEQLLRRIAEVPPATLRRDEIARLKNRLIESAVLRDELLADEAGRDYVRVALARVGETLDAVLAAAARYRPAQEPNSRRASVWLVGGVGGAAAVVLVVWALREKPTPSEAWAEVAKSQSEVSADQDRSKTSSRPKDQESNNAPVEASPLPVNPDPAADLVKGSDDEDTAKPQAVDDDFLDAAHPLQYEMSKEGFNVAVELKQALDSRSYAGALHIIVNGRADVELGLLTDVVDSHLLVPQETMVRLALRDHPPLRDLMRQRFAATAQLRLRRAVSQIDAPAVRSVALRFFGTDAAAEAEAWLGDRALSGGQFAAAVSHYERALSYAAAAQRHGIAARLRLAGAMIGREIGSPPLGSVVMGSATIEPAEFEKMVDEMLQRSNGDVAARPRGGMAGPDVPSAPPAMHYRTRPFAVIDGGVRGGNRIKRPTPQQDWAARGMSAMVAGDLLLVSNRAQLVALERATGKHRWAANFVRPRGDPSVWRWPAMHPLVVGGRIYVRRLTRSGPELTCVDARTGTVLWSAIPEEGDKKASRRGQPLSHVASDPLLVADKLMALTATVVRSSLKRGPAKDVPRLFQLALTAYDPQTGQVTSTVDLIQLRDLWQGVLPARAAPAGDGGGIVASVGGVTLRIDTAGNILWLRHQRWPAQQLDDLSWQQFHGRPLVRDDRAIVFQPGMRGVQCLDLDSGREIWQRNVSGVRRIIGLVEGHVIVRDAQGLLAIDVDDGKITWRRPLENLLETYACGAADQLLIARHHRVNNRSRIELVWLDPTTGATRAVCPLEDLTKTGDVSPAAHFGPLLLSGERLLVGFDAQGDNKRARKLIELIPTAQPLLPNTTPSHRCEIRDLRLYSIVEIPLEIHRRNH